MKRVVYIKNIPVTLEWRKVKNINVYIKNPDGKVLVTIPQRTSQKQVMDFLYQKQEWIVKHHEAVKNSTAGKNEKKEITAQDIEYLKHKIQEYAEKWEPIMEVHASHWTIREMKTRWGSCTVTTGRIRINARLVFYPEQCLEYIVVHELCHLLEPSHNQRFKDYMTKFLPDWKQREKLLRD